jgi:hypothetical protein
MARTYYVFGIDAGDHSHPATGEYTCLARFGDVPAVVEFHRKRGHDVFAHDGAEDGPLPVDPSPELAAAVRRSDLRKFLRSE